MIFGLKIINILVLSPKSISMLSKCVFPIKCSEIDIHTLEAYRYYDWLTYTDYEDGRMAV